MNIAVCIKQVPDTTELRIDPETNTLIRKGVPSILNPLDEFAVEAALRLRERVGGVITALTMGPPQAVEVLRQAMAMGVDRGVLVSDRCFAGADTWATSRTLAAALAHEGPFDLVCCGKQAIDGDTAQVGPGIAGHLGLPQITYVTAIEPEDQGTLRVTRLLDDGRAEIRVRLPAVFTVLKEANEPRLPTLSGRLRALRSEISVLDADALGLDADETGLKGSPTRVVRIRTPRIERTHLRIDGEPRVAARRLIEELRRRNLLHPDSRQGRDKQGS